MDVYKYYRNAVIYPSGVAFLGVIIFSIIDNYNYKSEWLSPAAAIFIFLIFSIIYCFLACLLALPILLNTYRKFKAHKILTFLSWFLIPTGTCIVVFHQPLLELITFKRELDSGFVHFAVLNLPLLVGLISSYLKFRKAVKLIVQKDTNNS